MSLTLYKDNISSTPTHIYYNIDLANNKTLDNGSNPNLSYNENRDTPILRDAQDYYFSIIRFQLNGLTLHSIPLCIPVIEEGSKNSSNDPNMTIYNVCVMYNSLDGNGNHRQNYSVKNIVYVPQNKSVSSMGLNDYSNDYYFVHTYDHFLKMVNKAMEDANNEASSKNGDISKKEPPRLGYDASSGNFNLYLDNSGYGRKDDPYIGNNDSKCRLFFNSNLYNLFANFPHDAVGNDVKNAIEYFQSNDLSNPSYTSIPECAYDIFPVRNLTTESKSVNGVNCFEVKQEFNSTSSFWSPVQSLTFTSNIVPVLAELSGTPIEFKDIGLNPNNSSDNKNDYRKIITDMIVPLGSPDSYKKTITYYPSSQYRMSEFTKARFDLRHIGIDGFFKLRRNGKLVPLKLPNQSSCSFKILFQHKSSI